jgi:hypothetical protein
LDRILIIPKGLDRPDIVSSRGEGKEETCEKEQSHLAPALDRLLPPKRRAEDALNNPSLVICCKKYCCIDLIAHPATGKVLILLWKRGIREDAATVEAMHGVIVLFTGAQNLRETERGRERETERERDRERETERERERE